jgi:predicted RNase H-like HicB family nuclease
MDCIRVLYHQDDDTWVALSPDLGEHWIAVADTLCEAHRLAEDGVRFVLGRDDVAIEHRVPASA